MGSVRPLVSHHDVTEANAALVAFGYLLRLEWCKSLFKLKIQLHDSIYRL